MRRSELGHRDALRWVETQDTYCENLVGDPIPYDDSCAAVRVSFEHKLVCYEGGLAERPQAAVVGYKTSRVKRPGETVCMVLRRVLKRSNFKNRWRAWWGSDRWRNIHIIRLMVSKARTGFAHSKGSNSLGQVYYNVERRILRTFRSIRVELLAVREHERSVWLSLSVRKRRQD